MEKIFTMFIGIPRTVSKRKWGKTYVFVFAKPAFFWVLMTYALLSKRQIWSLPCIQSFDLELKQRWVKTEIECIVSYMFYKSLLSPKKQ